MYGYPSHDQAVEAAVVVLSRLSGGKVSNAASVHAAYTVIGYALSVIQISESTNSPLGASVTLAVGDARAQLGTFVSGDLAGVPLLNWRGIEAELHSLLLSWMNFNNVVV